MKIIVIGLGYIGLPMAMPCGEDSSMDSGCITPEYVYRMWGGTVKQEEIKVATKT